MVRISLIIAGWLFILIGCLLLAFLPLRSSSTDAERAYIQEHHTYSTPRAFEWSAWQPNDGSVTHFDFDQPESQHLQKPVIAEYRRGKTHGVIFDFIAYEGRATGGAVNGSFPVQGPDWGAHYHGLWATSAVSLGIVLIFASRLFKRAENGSV